MTPSHRYATASLFAAILFASIATGWTQADLPANIDNNLRRIISEDSQRAAKSASGRRSGLERATIRDAQRRVLVEVHLNGKVPFGTVRSQITQLGAEVVSQVPSYKQGALSAYVPSARLVDVAKSPGILSVTLAHRPRKNVGAATSGGVFLLHTDMLNGQGLNGTGQTVGVLSDSFDTATLDLNGDPLTIHASQDIASGDLPGPGNPNNPNPVNVIEDFPDPDAADEGRAMLQIVHDVAPKANLAFATAFVSKMGFADNIRKLRTDANCSVIVDDIIYTEEPMFSDGIIAQAVDDVVTSSVLAGPKCTYLSSAGNYQGGGYESTFRPISDMTARAGLPNQNLKLDQVPMNLTSGGFHNFNPDPSGPVDISQRFVITAETTLEFSFQWNDPFDQTPMPPDRPGITTDYNILVFDADGNYLAAVSGIANNFSTQQAVEDILVENTGATDADHQIAIARAGTMPATPVATKLRYLAIDDFGGVGAEEYYQPKAPSGHGHNSAVNAISVAAYVYDEFPETVVAAPFEPFVEEFTSVGGMTVYFDATGLRLAVPTVRNKPDIAAPDGGNNTFFGDDFEGDGLPNFFGTSAAAPFAAGVAALMLQKAGGPATLTASQINHILQTTVTMEHDLDPLQSTAVSQGVRKKGRKKRFSGATITLTGTGNSSNASARDRNFFTLAFSTTKRKESLKSITINLTDAFLKFDTTTTTGFPFTLGKLVNINPNNISAVSIPQQTETISSITLAFTPGAFKNGSSITFGIDRDFIGNGGGNTGDYLEFGGFTASTTKNNLKGSFVNRYGFGFTVLDGFGLIDAVRAVGQAQPGPNANLGAP